MEERDALIVYAIRGVYGFRPDTGTVEKTYKFSKGITVTSFSVGSAEDTFNMGTYPYIDSISLNAYLEGVIKQPYQYYFNDLYIVPGISYLEEEQFYRYIKHPFETANDVAPLKMIDLRKKNKYYIWTEGKNAGKFWRLRGEWEHFVVPYKFRFFQYVSPETLIFDHYNVFVLKRVISLDEIDKPFVKDTNAKVITGLIPYGSKP